MIKISTGVTLAIILTTVYSNENVTKELPKSIKTIKKKFSNLVKNVIIIDEANVNKNITTEEPNSSQSTTTDVSNLSQSTTTDVSNLSHNITTEVQDSNRSITIEQVISKEDIIINGDTITVKVRSYFDPETDQVWKMYLSEKMSHFKEKLRTTTVMESDDDDAVTESYTPSNGPQDQDLDETNNERENESNSIENNSDVNEEATLDEDDILKLAKFLNRTVSSVNATLNVSRRQKQKLTKQGKLLLKMQEFAGLDRLKFERYREPYWKSGEYVFLRTGSPTTPRNKTEPWKFGQVTSTQNPMAVYRDCDRVCSHYYKAYGKICAHRLKTRGWENQYKNFDNICDMDHANCVDPNSRPHWHPMYKGVCGELHEFKQPPYDFTWVVKNVKKWDPYVYVPPTPTDPTADPLDEELKKALAQTEMDATKAG